MKKYILWIRISLTQTTNAYVYAENQLVAKMLGELQFGAGNVLSYTEAGVVL